MSLPVTMACSLDASLHTILNPVAPWDQPRTWAERTTAHAHAHLEVRG